MDETDLTLTKRPTRLGVLRLAVLRGKTQLSFLLTIYTLVPRRSSIRIETIRKGYVSH